MSHGRQMPLLLAAALLAASVGCHNPRPYSEIEWVDFIRFGGIQYVRAGAERPAPGAPPSVDCSALGPEFARVRFKVAGNVFNASYRSADGDAAYLDPGTPIYSLRGYRPEFILAAADGCTIRLYEAREAPNATQGSDLLDIGGKVDSISIRGLSHRDPDLAHIVDREAIDSFVAAVLAAPVDQSGARGGTRADQYFVVFHLHDGILLRRAYWTSSGQLHNGIMLPQEAQETIASLLADTGADAGIAPDYVLP